MSTTFNMSDLILLKSKYIRTLFILINNGYLCSEISNLVPATDLDNFASILVRILTPVDRTLFLIREAIEYEFRNNTRDPATILRGNCPASKIETQYCRLIGTGYLIYLFGELITEVIMDKEMVLEIDPEKAEGVEENAEVLKGVCERFIERIMGREALEMMPRDVRVIAGYTAEYAERYCPESKAALIGGFLNLRFIVPSIVAPDGFGLIEEDIVPDANARRNLILIAKILQKISNGNSATKEPYIEIMNDFCESYRSRMEDYLIEVATDPLLDEGYVPWNDFIYKTFHESDITIENLNIHDIFNLHRILYPLRSKIMEKFHDTDSFAIRSKQKQYENEFNDKEHRKSIRLRHGSLAIDEEIDRLLNHSQEDSVINVKATIEEFPHLLMSLGPPPSTKIYKYQLQKTNINTEHPESPRLASPRLSDISNNELDDCGFLYPGSTDKQGNVLIYFIAARLDSKYISSHNELSAYMAEKIAEYSDGNNYALVIDTSWLSGYDFNPTMISRARQYLGVSEHSQRKRAKAFYFVHPNSLIHSGVRVFKTFGSPKLAKKFVFINEWTDIHQYIHPDKLDLPAETRGYIAKAYIITKVNNAKKKQRRILKLTANSLLNIEPSGKKIKNEKLVTEISEITCSEDHTITINFMGAENGTGKRFWQNKKDHDTRIYVCSDDTQRDQIIQDIFEVVLRLDTIIHPLEYHIRKVKKSKFGETLSRTYKFTLDSLLSVDGVTIKKEMPFSSLISVQREKYDNRVLTLDFIDGRKVSLRILDGGNEDDFVDLVQKNMEHTKVLLNGQREDLLGNINRFIQQ